MKLILYIPAHSDPGNKLLDLAANSAPPLEINIYNTFDILSEQLSKSTKDVLMAVFSIPDVNDISLFLSIAPLLSGLKLFLVLPDRNKKTLDQAYKLFPRYVCTYEESYKELTLIMKKITQNIPTNQEEEK